MEICRLFRSMQSRHSTASFTSWSPLTACRKYYAKVATIRDLRVQLLCHTSLIILLLVNFVRGTRERSPPLPKIAHPSLPRLGRSQASTWPSAMHKSPPGGTACLITVSPMPGKLTYSPTLTALYPTAHLGVVMGYAKECYNLIDHSRVLLNSYCLISNC